MWRRTLFFFLSLALLVTSIAAMRSRPATADSPESCAQQTATKEDCVTDDNLIATLDQCIQERFRSTDGFGLSRIIASPQHLRYFSPRTEQEKSVVAQLQKAGWEVSLFLASRSVLLAQKPDKKKWDESFKHALHKPLSGPVSITQDARNAKLPDGLELWDDSRKALDAFSASNRYDFSVREWKIAARPIRATDQSCLNCHSNGAYSSFATRSQAKSSLRIGDPLGAVMYVYTRAK